MNIFLVFCVLAAAANTNKAAKKSKGDGACEDKSNCKLKGNGSVGKCKKANDANLKKCKATCGLCDDDGDDAADNKQDKKQKKKNKKTPACADKKCKHSLEDCDTMNKANLKKCKATCGECEDADAPPTPAPVDPCADKNCKFSLEDCGTMNKGNLKKCKATCGECGDDTTDSKQDKKQKKNKKSKKSKLRLLDARDLFV